MRNINGAGTTYYDHKRKKFIWRGFYYAPNGEKKRKGLQAADRKTLMEKVKAWKKELEDGKLPLNHQITLQELAETWLSFKESTISQGTLKGYESDLRAHILPRFGQRKARSLNAVEIQYWINSLTRKSSSRTVNRIRGTFRNMMSFAYEQGLVQVNVMKGVKNVKNNSDPIRIPSKGEVQQLLSIAKEGNYYNFSDDDFGRYLQREVCLIVTIAVRTGMRVAEILALQWRYIDFLKNSVLVAYSLNRSGQLVAPKTAKSRRLILLDEGTTNLLSNWKSAQTQYMSRYAGIVGNPQGLVFTTQVGTPMRYDNFRFRYWDSLTKAAGLPHLHFHSLRHFTATTLLAAGIPSKAVSELLGHSTTRTTIEVYQSVLMETKHEIVSVIESLIDEKESPVSVGAHTREKGSDK